MAELRDIRTGQFGFHREPQESLPASIYQRAKENIAPDWQQMRQEGFGLDYPSLETLESSMPQDVSLSEIGQKGLEKTLDLVTPLGVGTIVGKGATSFRKELQEASQEMLDQGMPMRKVTAETGYYKDRYGNWKTQISDVESSVSPQAVEVMRNWNPSQKLNEGGRWPSRKLRSIYNHDELYKNYPWMANNVDVKFSTDTPYGAVKMKLDDKTGKAVGGTIFINPQGVVKYARLYGLSGEDALKSMINHETNHVIQAIDNLPSGSSEAWWSEVKKKTPIFEKKLNAVEEKLRSAPANHPLRAKWQEEADEYIRHLDFIRQNADTKSEDLYYNTQGEMDAFWSQATREDPNVRFRLPLHEDRRKVLMEGGVQYPVLEHRVGLTSPGTALTGTATDVSPLSKFEPVPYKELNSLERRLVSERRGDARIKGIIAQLREQEQAGLISERERFQRLNELTQPVKGEWR
jgi:hypothetical protein